MLMNVLHNMHHGTLWVSCDATRPPKIIILKHEGNVDIPDVKNTGYSIEFLFLNSEL